MPAAAHQHDITHSDDDVEAILAAHGGDARAALRSALDEAALALAQRDRMLEHVSEGYVRGRGRAAAG